MILCLDMGNTTIHGGVFDGETLRMQFRKTSDARSSSDETGLFLRGVLRENGIDPASIEQIALASVVPDAVHSMRNSCIKYFGKAPFILQAGVKTGLKIKYRNPLEVGADRIANAIAVTHLYPDQDAIIVDFGTATTFCAVNREKEYLGGVILAGLRLSMEALEEKTAKLPSVEIIPMKQALGRSTVESIQSGLFFGQLGQVKELKARITEEVFGEKSPIVIGTGGFSGLFDKSGIFDVIVPDLVLRGLYLALRMNA